MEYEKLEKLCSVICDCNHATPKWTDSGYIVVRNFNIKNGQMDLSNPSYTDEPTYNERIKRAIPLPGDLIITREAPMGEVAMIPEGTVCCLGQRTVLLRPNPELCDNKYLLYALQSPYVQKQISWSQDTGTTVSNLRIPHLARLSIPYSSLAYQKNVVRVLEFLDCMIRQNKEYVALLQHAMHIVYDYWFTQFDFPDADSKPYHASGGEMTHSDELGIDIPAGWEVKPLSTIVRQIKPKLTAGEPVPMIDLSVMPNDSIYLSELHSSDDFTSNLFAMKKGSILFGSIRPYLHKAGIAPCDGAIAGTVYQFEPIETEFYNFALAALTHPRMFDFAVAKSQGTRMPVIKVDQLLSYKVPYNEEFMRKFNELPIAEMVTTAVMETQQLTKLRDFLLPLLMSGQVTVTDDEETDTTD